MRIRFLQFSYLVISCNTISPRLTWIQLIVFKIISVLKSNGLVFWYSQISFAWDHFPDKKINFQIVIQNSGQISFNFKTGYRPCCFVIQHWLTHWTITFTSFILIYNFKKSIYIVFLPYFIAVPFTWEIAFKIAFKNMGADRLNIWMLIYHNSKTRVSNFLFTVKLLLHIYQLFLQWDRHLQTKWPLISR